MTTAYYLNQLGIEPWILRESTVVASVLKVVIVFEAIEQTWEGSLLWPTGKAGRLLKQMMRCMGVLLDHVHVIEWSAANGLTQLETVLQSQRLRLDSCVCLFFANEGAFCREKQWLQSNYKEVQMLHCEPIEDVLKHPIKKRDLYLNLMALQQLLEQQQ